LQPISAPDVHPSQKQAPLLPKLRGQSVEFLNEGYPARLRILSPSTCVGLRYGHLKNSLTRFFSAVWGRPVPALRLPIRLSELGLEPGKRDLASLPLLLA